MSLATNDLPHLFQTQADYNKLIWLSTLFLHPYGPYYTLISYLQCFLKQVVLVKENAHTVKQYSHLFKIGTI